VGSAGARPAIRTFHLHEGEALAVSAAWIAIAWSMKPADKPSFRTARIAAFPREESMMFLRHHDDVFTANQSAPLWSFYRWRT
jgi:hypothetical protein